MKKVKINIDRQNISSEEINSRRDFQSLLENYQGITSQNVSYQATSVKSVVKKFLMTNYLNIYCATVIGSIGMLMYSYTSDKASISPGKKDNLYKQTALAIPVQNNDTFMSRDTSSSNEEQELFPLTIQSDDENSLEASVQNTNPLVQNLETSNPLQRDIASEVAKLKEEIRLLQEKIEELEKEKPLKPEKPKGYRFRMDIDPVEFPKASKYKEVLFEVPEEEKKFSPDFMKSEWDKVKISDDKDGKFKLTLSKGKESYSFKVTPIFEEKAYPTALKEYELYLQKIDSYTVAKVNKEKELELLK